MCDVGLSLKPIGGIQANTTFPSKVLEYSESGLLIVSTDISDVKKLFGQLAIILYSNEVAYLVKELKKIVSDRKTYREMALKGKEMLLRTCSEEIVSDELLNFLFENKVDSYG
jgi:glycosyltransferase involved in cell wall biosynthesis